VLFGRLALLERVFQFPGNRGVALLAPGVQCRVPIDTILFFALVMVRGLVFPVLKKPESCQFILFDGPSMFSSEFAAHVWVVLALVFPHAQYERASMVATDRDTEGVGYIVKV
jgi:hypothetical protein